MYSALYDSTIAWYKRWYPDGLRLQIISSGALAVAMALYVLSAVNIASAIGLIDEAALKRAVPFVIPFMGGLWVIHLLYGHRRARSAAPIPSTHAASRESRRLAPYYIAGSFIFFAATFALMITLGR